MRKLLLASAAFVALGSGVAVAAGGVDFTVTSDLAESCSIAAEETDVTAGPLAATVGTANFTTTCNFEDADMTLTFVSDNGGLYNDVEDVTKDYTIAYGAANSLASTTTTVPLEVIAPAGPVVNLPVNRSFTVTLVSDIVIAGEYEDTVTVSVAP